MKVGFGIVGLGTRGTMHARVYSSHPQARLDAVSIATPDLAHVEPVELAARARKHILVEKPLATTVEEARRLAEIVRSAGVKLMVDFHKRWNRAMCTAKRAVGEGEIGRPVFAYIRLSDTLFVPTQMLSWAHRSSPLWFLGSHCVDLAGWLLADEVASVYATSRSTVLKGLGIDTPDVCHTVLHFTKGAVAVMENGQ